MLLTLLEPHAKSYGNSECASPWLFKSSLSLDHAQTKINAWHAVKDLMSCSHLNVQTAHVYDCNKQPTSTTGYHWHNACLMCKRETHFLLVFFAFALFFLAWSARTVRRKEWAVNYFAIVWVLVCCLTLETIKKGWHCLRGRIPHLYLQFRSSGSVWWFISCDKYLNHNCSASVRLIRRPNARATT